MSTDVLLTRPVGDNDALKQELEAAGMACRIVPMIEITAADLGPQRSVLLELDQYDHVIFVSRNAVRYGVPALEDFWPQWPSHINWFAVGQGTAEELRRFDIEPHVPTQADSIGLLNLDGLRSVAGQRVLIVRGNGGRTVLKTELEARGASVVYLEVYAREPASAEPGIAATLAHNMPAVIVIYSSAALDGLCRMTSDRDPVLVVPSSRIEMLAREAGFAEVVAARSAELADMRQAILGTRS